MTNVPSLELADDVRSRLRFALPLALVVALFASLAIDLPIATHARQGRMPRWVSDLLENAEVFGHGIGVSLIVIAVFVLDPARRRWFPALVASSLGAGLVANGFKLAVQRTRPRDLGDFPATVWGTFDALSSQGSHSFPSAHTATAVGLAVALSTFYPHGRWYFITLASLVGLQRIHCSAHFPSDVIAGAIVGWAMASVCLRLASRRFGDTTCDRTCTVS